MNEAKVAMTKPLTDDEIRMGAIMTETELRKRQARIAELDAYIKDLEIKKESIAKQFNDTNQKLINDFNVRKVDVESREKKVVESEIESRRLRNLADEEMHKMTVENEKFEKEKAELKAATDLIAELLKKLSA